MKFTELLQKKIVIADGAMGSLLLSEGLQPGETPEMWNLTHPEIIRNIHHAYLAAGSDFVITATFGANALKLPSDLAKLVPDFIRAGVDNARAAAEKFPNRFVGLDLGPTGKLLRPAGDAAFADVYDAYAGAVAAGAAAGADFAFIETMGDTMELKAAVLAVKENSALPVVASCAFAENGHLLTGASVAAVVALLEGLGVDVIGLNCGLGPEAALPVVTEMLEYSSTPVMLKPNAGLPVIRDGRTVYQVVPADFAAVLRRAAAAGVRVLGGCCGTSPEYIAAAAAAVADMKPVSMVPKTRTLVSSGITAVEISSASPVIIGERINPTGKKKFQAALLDHDLNYVIREGIAQEENGAHILDVNVGLPGVNESELLPEVVRELQAVTALPLQLDSPDPDALEAALRQYNGKALVNSVNGKTEVLHRILPLVRKYGAVVVGLCLDENGIPETVEGRLAVAQRIIDAASEYGIGRKDVIIDPLCMTVASNSKAAAVTLATVRALRDRLGVNTVLGVSNVSFGLPNRSQVNAAMLLLALQNGLCAGIINPNSPEMSGAVALSAMLQGRDENCTGYLRFCENYQVGSAAVKTSVAAAPVSADLKHAIIRGVRDDAGKLAAELLKSLAPLEIINQWIVPALDAAGVDFEAGRLYLPQLLLAADSAAAAFEAVKGAISGENGVSRGKVLLATVKGDIHDIGKNIVRTLLENYGFTVRDLGKDVPPETIVEIANREQIRLVGLSALMTTTVPAMAETIRQLRASGWTGKVVVGGAVLTPEYAAAMGADCYSKEAMNTVRYALEVLA